jgi:soluble lytic murein transglycosylase-like protein
VRSAKTLAAALLVVAAPALLEAQIYTRRTPSGSIEATNIPGGAGYRLIYPGKGHLIHSKGFRVGRYRGEFDGIIESASAAYGVGTALIHAVIRAESAYDQFAVSSKGARGLMQLMPPTARQLGVTDSFDAYQNIFGGTRYLRLMLDTFDDNLPLALAAYNAGPTAVRRHKGIPPYKETIAYVQKIQSWIPRATSHSLSFVPRQRQPEPTQVSPAPPRIYYKYRDDRGTLHVSNQRPPEGIAYTMIRALH